MAGRRAPYAGAMTSYVTHLACSRCAANHEARIEQHVCTSCGGPLYVEYDLGRIRDSLRPSDLTDRPPTMWRYRELLPLTDPTNLVSMGEGFTPLVRAPGLARRLGLRDLWVKDEAHNPTGTFKDRGASSGLSVAREFGITEFSVPSLGNAGGSWACYGAAAGVSVHVTLPTGASELCRAEVLACGAELIVSGATLPEAAATAADRAGTAGWYDAATWREPYRLDGKRTLGLEIAEQLGWSMPDVVVYPTGGGIGVVAIRRALLQLRQLGWVAGDLPRLVAVQAEGCAPVVKAVEEGAGTTEMWPDVRTIASGIGVPASPGHPLVLEAIRETGGTAVSVTDHEMLEALVLTAAETGILPCPEGAATLAALPKLRDAGAIDPAERIVAVSTGTGLRYPEAMRSATSAR